MDGSSALGQFDFASIPYFYSYEFLVFFAIVFVLFWSTPKAYRRHFLTFASYCFYGSWDYRFLGLLWISTLTDFFCARAMEDVPTRRKTFLYLSIAINVGQLAIFKYLGFFVDGARELSVALGMPISVPTLEIILPLGISFYTFQSLSYTIDVYRRKIPAVRDFFTFTAFGSFFPQLIAGPIERAGHLIPQLRLQKNLSEIDYRTGLYLFAYGLFKKRVIADSLVVVVERAYEGPDAGGALIAVGFVAAFVRLYCDISGYADMARGLALLLGIELSKNFDFPYFSRNPVEFWNRWHITLSHWVRNYLYNPLLLWTRSPVASLLLAFIVMGLWHGPYVHYINWGLYWAAASIVHQYVLRRLLIVRFPTLGRDWVAYPAMFLVALVGQSFFQAKGVAHYLSLMGVMFTDFDPRELFEPAKALFCIAIVGSYEFYSYKRRDELWIPKRNFYVQLAFYFVLFFLYRNIGRMAAVDFVYFQF